MQLAGDGFFGPAGGSTEAHDVLRAVVAAGLNHIDTTIRTIDDRAHRPRAHRQPRRVAASDFHVGRVRGDVLSTDDLAAVAYSSLGHRKPQICISAVVAGICWVGDRPSSGDEE